MKKPKLKITEQDLNEMLSRAYNAGYINRKFDEQKKKHKKKKKKSSCECTGSCHKEMILENPVAKVIHISSPEDMENFLNSMKSVSQIPTESIPSSAPNVSLDDNHIDSLIDEIGRFLSGEDSIPGGTILAFVKPENDSCNIYRVTPGKNEYTGAMKILTNTVIDFLKAIREFSDGEE